MGKLRVYASGAVKLVLGNVSFDVAPGNRIHCMQQLAAIDSTNGKVGLAGWTLRARWVTLKAR
jgi:hypothetical protein